MKSLTRIKQSAVPAALMLALLQSCGGGSNPVTSLPGPSNDGGLTSVSASVGTCFAGDVTFAADAFDTSPVEVGGATFVLVDLPDAPDFYAALEEDAGVVLGSEYCAEDAVNAIYQNDPTVVTFDDYVLVRALSTLPPSLRTAENIATAANDLFQDRETPYQADDFGPIPDEINTNYVTRGSTPAPDLLDAALVFAASLLPDEIRTLENLVATVNAVFPGANLVGSEVAAIPPELPGGIPVDPAVGPVSAGNIQISVFEDSFAAPEFTVGAAEFTQLPTTIFPGFTSYAALAGSSLIEVEFAQLNIPGATAQTCIVVHTVGDNPVLSFNQLATSSACDFTGDAPLQSDPDVALSLAPTDFTVQILHAADQEAGVAALDDAPRFSQVIEALAAEFSNTLRLASGDLWIPGAFYNTTLGEADVAINSALGFEASAFGNHEFDLGTRPTRDLIRLATFPFLSANLDFSQDGNLSGETESAGLEASTIPGRIAPSVVITVNGERFGIVGATTPQLGRIASPGDVMINPADEDDIPGLAAIIQAEVDALTGTGIDKVIVLAHLQQIENEIQLAGLLEDVDVIIAGGSDTLLANPGNRIRTEFGKDPSGQYPLFFNSASDEPVALVNTDREYRYVGRLIVEFDANGIIAGIGANSRPFPTDDQGVTETGNAPADPVVLDAIEEVGDILEELDGPPFFGPVAVFLNGERQDVRTQETNLGNLTADANLAAAQAVDPTTVVSIKNGGGIRASIGAILPGDEGLRVPPVANPNTGKMDGDVSRLDIQNALRFNNGLTLLTVSREELKDLLEHGVANIGGGQTIQVGGLKFSYDPDGTAIVFDDDANVTTPGTRIQNVALIDDTGAVTEVIVQDGAVVSGDDIRLVTLNFLADPSADDPDIGGDGYPFPTFGENVVDLFTGDDTTFEADGREQEALADFLDTVPDFDLEDTAPAEDERIQNLNERADTILP